MFVVVASIFKYMYYEASDYCRYDCMLYFVNVELNIIHILLLNVKLKY